MGKWGIFSPMGIVLAVALALMATLAGCQKETPNKPLPQQVQTASAEVDIQKITAQTGIRFRIIKTDTRGYMPLYKFFWVCVPDQTPNEKVEALVREIIKATVAKFSNTYHSFTFHLFYESKLTGKPEDCQPFARATFLPEGDWIKAGRSPIDDYKTYQLALEFTGKGK
jgi:hypothetical protein